MEINKRIISLLFLLIPVLSLPVLNIASAAPDETRKQMELVREQINKKNQFQMKAFEAGAKGNYQEALEFSKQYLDTCNSDAFISAMQFLKSRRKLLESQLLKMKGQKPEPSQRKQLLDSIDHINLCRTAANKQIAEYYTKLGRYEDAMKYCEDGLGYAESLDDPSQKKGYYQLISEIYTGLGRPEEAEKYRKQASQIDIEAYRAKLNESRPVLPEEVNDRLDRIKQSIDKMKSTLENVSGLRAQANKENSIGLYIRALNTYDRALKTLNANRKGLDVFEHVAVGQIMDILYEKGLIYYKIKDYTKAESSVSEAEKLEGEVKNLFGRIYGDEYENMKNLDRSGNLARQQQLFQSVATKPNKFNHLLLLTDIYRVTGRYNDAFSLLDSISVELTDTPTEQIRYHTHKGRLLNSANRLSESSYEYLKAVNLIEGIRGQIKQEKSGFFTVEDRTNAYRGLVSVLSERALKGERDDRFISYGNDLLSAAFYFSELTKGRTLLEKMADSEERARDAYLPDQLRTKETLLLKELSQINEKLEITPVQNAGTLKSLKEDKEKLSSALNTLINELWDKYPGYAAFHYPRPIQANRIPLKDDETLIEYAIGDDACYAFIVKKSGVKKIVKILIGREKLEEKIQAFMSKMNIEKLSDFSSTEAHELYDIVLADALKDINKTDKLIIVPDGILGLLPFEALIVKQGKNYRDSVYVGDRRMINYVHSAAALALNRMQKPTSAPKPLFALGNPIYSKSDQRYIAYMQKQEPPVKLVAQATAGLRAVTVMPKSYKVEGGDITWEEVTYNPLPETEDEVKIIASFFGVPLKPPDILLNINANETTLRSVLLFNYRYIHFATHADTGGKIQNIKEPFLLLGQVENKEGDNGFFTLSKVLGLKLDADIVVLSACLTGRGRVMEGEGIASFARAFQYAGARSIVTSLWEVPSKETVEYMTIFYRNLSLGKSKGESLAIARGEMKRKYPHPYYWAPFIIHGER